MDKYNYDLIQYEFYNQRQRAIRRVMEGNGKGCLINLDEVYSSFSNRFSKENNDSLPEYQIPSEDTVNRINEMYDSTITLTEVLAVMKRIKVDTAPGPDRVIMRSIKNEMVPGILVLIFNKIKVMKSLPQV